MDLDPIEWCQIELLSGHVPERRTADLFGKLLRPGDTYVDVGAHVGFHTLVARRHLGHQGRVIAVEPQPYNCNKIDANWRVNGFSNIIVCVAAAGERNDMVELNSQATSDRSRLSLCLPGVNDQPLCFRVPLVRLDSLLEQLKCDRIRLLKIDVEGYELEVIRGLGAWVEKIDHVIAEVLDWESPSARTTDLLALLANLGFELKNIEGASWNAGENLPENNLWGSRVRP
ncbi:MAG TPA: FkbM family methyltransferase [Pirellulales bacterium]|nr:FkbM family methyltransferase [Pirellulales bacterium]